MNQQPPALPADPQNPPVTTGNNTTTPVNNSGGNLTTSPQNSGHLPAPRNASNLNGGPLQNATQVRGRFTLENGPPNGTTFRADNQGNITSYATYDSQGMIIKRVDVTGAAHRGVPTPHVIEYGRNTYTNNSGQTITRVQSPDTKLPPRPATAAEIP